MTRETETILVELARNQGFASPAIAAAVAGVRKAIHEISCDPDLRQMLRQRARLALSNPIQSANRND